MNDVLVAIDVGTSGARASAFAADGEPVAEVTFTSPIWLGIGVTVPSLETGVDTAEATRPLSLSFLLKRLKKTDIFSFAADITKAYSRYRQCRR
jgi:hypothetical protein